MLCFSTKPVVKTVYFSNHLTTDVLFVFSDSHSSRSLSQSTTIRDEFIGILNANLMTMADVAFKSYALNGKLGDYVCPKGGSLHNKTLDSWISGIVRTFEVRCSQREMSESQPPSKQRANECRQTICSFALKTTISLWVDSRYCALCVSKYN